jgi:hypothetical protein
MNCNHPAELRWAVIDKDVRFVLLGQMSDCQSLNNYSVPLN